MCQWRVLLMGVRGADLLDRLTTILFEAFQEVTVDVRSRLMKLTFGLRRSPRLRRRGSMFFPRACWIGLLCKSPSVLRRGEDASGVGRMRLQSWMMLMERQGVVLSLNVVTSLMVVDGTIMVRCSLLLSCVLCAFSLLAKLSTLRVLMSVLTINYHLCFSFPLQSKVDVDVGIDILVER